MLRFVHVACRAVSFGLFPRALLRIFLARFLNFVSATFVVLSSRAFAGRSAVLHLLTSA
ncbi:hypothetical protein PSAC2689_190088 [Paraburkholderia sacchari]